jgi:cytoskeletal protein CcmA (bactofilin family)
MGDWHTPTLEITSQSPIHLTTHTLRGNIILTAPHVTISPQAHLQDILIIANGIHIESGFKGRLQLFATDSLYIEPNCTLNYPSAAVLACTHELGTLYMGEESRLEGLLLSDATLIQQNTKTESTTTIDTKAEVIGNVIVVENLDLKGTVTGNLITGKFRLQTSAALYENHLLDATIQSEGRSPHYAMPLLQEGPQQYLEILQLKLP